MQPSDLTQSTSIVAVGPAKRGSPDSCPTGHASSPPNTGCSRAAHRRFTRTAACRALLAAALMVAMVVLKVPGNPAAFGSAASVQSHVDANGKPIGPIANWIDDIIEILEDIADDLEDAALAVGTNPGPLDQPEKSRVANDLNAALADINQILDPNQYPSLDPPDAGSIKTHFDPQTLPDYAITCLKLAQDALDEANSRIVNHKVIGSRLKTIEHLITRESPHNYRTQAGIASQG